jgi:hypothetical protein
MHSTAVTVIGMENHVFMLSETRVVDPYSFFTDPDPDPDGGQYGSGHGSGSNPDPGL